MKRCIILTSQLEGRVTDLITQEAGDFILCADGGLVHALEQGLRPDLLIGDMDSLEESSLGLDGIPPGLAVIRTTPKKDRTDTGLCLSYAVAHGAKSIVVLGGLGGRLDHTYANLQDCVDCHLQGVAVALFDRDTRVFFVTDNELVVPRKQEFTLSVFSWTPVSRGVTLSGVAYPLTGHDLTNNYPLGTSNEFISDEATIRVEKGTLIVICSRLPEKRSG